MRVSKLMQTNLVLASEEATFETLLGKIGLLAPRQIYVVKEGLKLVGIVTGYDLLKIVKPFYLDSKLARTIPESEMDGFLVKCIEKVKNVKAKDIMITDFVFLKPEDHTMEAEALIVERGLNALPVLNEDKRILGEISRREILTYFAKIYEKYSLDLFNKFELKNIQTEEHIQKCYEELQKEAKGGN
ncbi:MAG: CBS domain-containing protein [Desulfonauticus sp.]|nr:CBS domain-containing protein [Desulfonauticus sp.]